MEKEKVGWRGSGEVWGAFCQKLCKDQGYYQCDNTLGQYRGGRADMLGYGAYHETAEGCHAKDGHQQNANYTTAEPGFGFGLDDDIANRELGYGTKADNGGKK
jgi:hypothetical protein